jgi:hypothetical protein
MYREKKQIARRLHQQIMRRLFIPIIWPLWWPGKKNKSMTTKNIKIALKPKIHLKQKTS